MTETHNLVMDLSVRPTAERDRTVLVINHLGDGMGKGVVVVDKNKPELFKQAVAGLVQSWLETLQ